MGRTERAKKILNDSHGFIALQTLFDFFFFLALEIQQSFSILITLTLSLNKNAKIESSQNPTILTSCLVNNAYLSYH